MKFWWVMICNRNTRCVAICNEYLSLSKFDREQTQITATFKYLLHIATQRVFLLHIITHQNFIVYYNFRLKYCTLQRFVIYYLAFCLI